VWRVAFRCVGADDRIVRRNDAALDADKLAKIEARLARMDRAASAGPWTRQTLALIAAHPAKVSSVLARRMNMDRAAFKINVRKLKGLGLTESLEIGYRLSPLGEAFVRASPSA
jgi:predicted transcriptional regulator